MLSSWSFKDRMSLGFSCVFCRCTKLFTFNQKQATLQVIQHNNSRLIICKCVSSWKGMFITMLDESSRCSALFAQNPTRILDLYPAFCCNQSTNIVAARILNRNQLTSAKKPNPAPPDIHKTSENSVQIMEKSNTSKDEVFIMKN